MGCFLAKKRNHIYAENLSVRYKMFEDFASSKFRLSKRYNSKQELTGNAHKYSAFVVGSDQLWLPSNIAADYYTLNFVPLEIPKIALATSFGISKLPKKTAELASKFLDRFNHISVRETSGQKIAQELTKKDVAVVCDPTIMFNADDWTKALEAAENGNRFADGQKYIFVYFLGNNPWQRELVKKIRTETNMKIVQIAHSDEYVKTDVGFSDYCSPSAIKRFVFKTIERITRFGSYMLACGEGEQMLGEIEIGYKGNKSLCWHNCV